MIHGLDTWLSRGCSVAAPDYPLYAERLRYVNPAKRISRFFSSLLLTAR
jgi:hypothetical protein